MKKILARGAALITMILDELGEFCDATAVAAAAGTALVGDVIDLGATSRDMGNGETIYLVIQTDTEVVTGGAAGTIEFQLVSDSTADLATSPTIHFSTGSLVTDDSALNDNRLNAGGLIACVALPLGTYERYLGILCVTGTTPTTAGKINAFLTKDPTGWKAYPDGI